MKVLLVTTWNTPCGIAEHSRMLKEAVEHADPTIQVDPRSEALDPTQLLRPDMGLVHLNMHDKPAELLIHLNHHDGLHSRWTPDYVRQIRESGVPVVVTYHDTRSGEPGAENSEKLKALAQIASATIVHEPVADVPGAIYWRQGVPAPATRPAVYQGQQGYAGWMDPTGYLYQHSWLAYPQQPVLGSVGFNFPWKNFTRLADETRMAGWALVLIAHDATEAQEAEWKQLNPHSLIIRQFLSQDSVVGYLAGCDATAFMYECQNNGTSGAIRQGIAARKPVIALEGCRQFRDLQDPDLDTGILWPEDWQQFHEALQKVRPMAWHPQIAALAHRDSWTEVGRRYAQLYRSLVP